MFRFWKTSALRKNIYIGTVRVGVVDAFGERINPKDS